MLITPSVLDRLWGVHPRAVLHVGAHKGEELASYEQEGWGSERVVWVEAQGAEVQELRDRIVNLGLASRHQVIQAAVWGQDGHRMKLKVTNNGESTSLLKMGSHATSYPEIRVTHEIEVCTTRLDSLFGSGDGFDLLVLDIQGAELQALQGFSDHLKRTSWIYSEINTGVVYENCAKWSEVRQFLAGKGFVCVDWQVTDADWGDALWIRKDLKPRYILARRLARKLKRRFSS